MQFLFPLDRPPSVFFNFFFYFYFMKYLNLRFNPKVNFLFMGNHGKSPFAQISYVDNCSAVKYNFDNSITFA